MVKWSGGWSYPQGLKPSQMLTTYCSAEALRHPKPLASGTVEAVSCPKHLLETALLCQRVQTRAKTRLVARRGIVVNNALLHGFVQRGNGLAESLFGS